MGLSSSSTKGGSVIPAELATMERRRQQAARNKSLQVVNAEAKPEAPSLFIRRAMVEAMKEAAQRPMPRKLIGDLLCEGELAISFAETGAGKTAKAVQCGNDIASGHSTTGLAVESEAQPVLYFDFELSDTQHARRYSEEHRNGDGQTYFTNLYPFHRNFERVEMDASAHVFDRIIDFEQFILREMDRVIVESGARVIIIDNITYLARETDKGKFALPLMQRLSEWKKERGLSILVLAHTPKRDESKPLSINDLAGSKILSNFADSVFGIGKSVMDSSIRYVKQMKVRSGELVYSADNVGVFQFEKTSNHLGFSLVGHSKESKHLAIPTDEAKAKLLSEVLRLSESGKTQRQIASELQLSVGMINRHLKTIKENEADRFVPAWPNDPERQAQWNSWKG